MSTSSFQAYLWNDEQWEPIGPQRETFDAAELDMYANLNKRSPNARVVETITTIEHKIRARATYMGMADDEIVDAVIKARDL